MQLQHNVYNYRKNTPITRKNGPYVSVISYRKYIDNHISQIHMEYFR